MAFAHIDVDIFPSAVEAGSLRVGMGYVWIVPESVIPCTRMGGQAILQRVICKLVIGLFSRSSLG